MTELPDSNSLPMRLYLLVKYADTKLLELFIGSFCFLWGVYMLLPIDSFSSAEMFTYIANILPESMLGIVLAASGFSTILFSVHDPGLGRKLTLFINHLIWVFLTAFAIMGNYNNPAVTTYFLLSATLAYLFLRSPICSRRRK